MNVLKLTPADLTALLIAYSLGVESATLCSKWNKSLYAAAYDVTLVDDGSFEDDERDAQVYIYFERNGTIVAEL